MVCMSALLCTLPFGLAQNSTSISGIINSNTTWTKANSPYSLTGPTRVANGANLVIEAGVIVNFNSYSLEINGTLAALGTPNLPIQFSYGSASSGSIIFSQFSTIWNEQTGTGCIIKNTIMTAVTLSINSSPKITNNTMRGPQGGASTIIITAGSPIIVNNVINGGFESSNTISIHGGFPVISNNKITGYVDNGLLFLTGMDTKHMARFGASTGIVINNGNVHLSNNELATGYYAISINAGTAIIERNLFGTFVTGAITAGPVAKVTIQNNTFTADSGGICGATSSATIGYNNIENTYSYNIQVGQAGTINAANNWWGTTNTSAIASKIQGDTVNFTSFLTEPNLQALPNSTPSSITLPAPPKETRTTIAAPLMTIPKVMLVTITGTLMQDTISLQSMVIRLTAVDPNGNSLEIGTATTDSSGIYSRDWMPVIEGTYAVTAEFRGTETYSTSSATTQVTIGSASTETPTATTTATPVSSAPTQTPAPSTTPALFQNSTLLPAQTSGALTPTGFNVVDGALLIGMISIICVVAALLVIMFKKDE